MRNEYEILFGKTEGKVPVATLRHRWKDNSKTNLEEMVLKVMDWCHTILDRHL
jgi:hypothetical protein